MKAIESIPQLIDALVETAVLVETDWGTTSTGFLMTRYVEENKARVFLVSARHSLVPGPKVADEDSQISFHFRASLEEGRTRGKHIFFPMQRPNGKPLWRAHPDPDVDVAAVEVTEAFKQFPDLPRAFMDCNNAADLAALRKKEVSFATEVLIIGHPELFDKERTEFPVVQTGIIASRLGEPLVFTSGGPAAANRREIKGFLVDGGIIPGSGGSPIILKPVMGQPVAGGYLPGGLPPWLIGMVVEAWSTRFGEG